MRRYKLIYAHAAIAIAFGGTGCIFDRAGVEGQADASPNGPDADPNAPDAAPDAPPVDTCGWEFDPVHFDACEDPPNNLEPLVLTAAGSPYIYNSFGVGTFRDKDDVAVPHDDKDIGGNKVIFASEVVIESGAELRVVGPVPVVIVSTSNFTVVGAINASSSWVEEDGEYSDGAGAQPDDCTTPPEDGAQPGFNCEHGGGGGGGGGLGGVGGVGGEGAPTRDCVDHTGAPGGTGGQSVTASTTLRGGCSGADGGHGNNVERFGIGGAGGGAVHLTAKLLLDIQGQIHAGGAGGRGGAGNRSAGGGGGSGGMIGLEAESFTFQSGAVLAANGGGGGGGGNGVAIAGEDAPPDGLQALGGAGDNEGGGGGDGGHGSTVDGLPGGVAQSRGGGGGGGAAGFIVYYGVAPEGTATRISPLPTTIP